MESTPERSSDDINRETSEEHEEQEETRSNPADTAESEMRGSAEPGTVATPEGTAEVDEELEDRGDV